MSGDELDRTLWELLDGALDGEARTALEARLAADPAARERLRQLEAMAGLFHGLEPVEPPAELPAAIVRALAGRQPRRRPFAAARAWLHELLAPRWRVRLAWTCVGAVVGVAIALLHPSLRPTPAEDVSRYYGAMARPDAVATALLELPGGRGRLTFDRGARLLGVLLTARAEGGPAVLELAGPGLELRAVSGSGAAAPRVTSSALGVVVEAGGEGAVEVTVGVPGGLTRLPVRLAAGSRELFARELDLPAPPAGGDAPTSGGSRSN